MRVFGIVIYTVSMSFLLLCLLFQLLFICNILDRFFTNKVLIRIEYYLQYAFILFGFCGLIGCCLMKL